MTDLDWLKNEKAVSESLQGSEAWLKFRMKGIGSSDVPVIMGDSPWKTIYELWLEKTDQLPEEKKFKGNWATERGQRLEPEVRSKYEAKVGALFSPEIAIHPEHNFARASFDGINHDLKKIIEIKCPGKDSHQKALDGKIPDVYLSQCQWLLFVSGYQDLDYISWDGESDLIIVPVKADAEYQNKILEAAKAFWHLVETRTAPPSDDLQIHDQELEAILMERHALKEQADALNAKIDALTDQIKARVPEASAVCAGFKITWSEVKGSVDYAKVIELKGVNLEPYRKKPSKRFQITKYE